MPAPRTGGLYRTRRQPGWADFVEAVPSRVVQDGAGTFRIKPLPSPDRGQPGEHRSGRLMGCYFFVSSMYTLSVKEGAAGAAPPACWGASPTAVLISSSDLPCLTMAAIVFRFSSSFLALS